MPRRKLSREFKVSAVPLVDQQGYSVAEAAKSLGVDPNCVRGWIGKFGKDKETAPTGEGAVQAELRRVAWEGIWYGAPYGPDSSVLSSTFKANHCGAREIAI